MQGEGGSIQGVVTPGPSSGMNVVLGRGEKVGRRGDGIEAEVATEPDSAKMSVCATAVSASTPNEIKTARSPARDLLIEGSTNPWV